MALSYSTDVRLPSALLAACARGDPAAAALAWGNFGVPVLPLWSIDQFGRCGCGDPGCRHPGKHPHGDLAPRGYRSATTDPARLRYVFEARPDANVGLRMRCAPRAGRPLAALDVDPRRGGDEALSRLQKSVGLLPPTTTIRTGGGGEHRLFALSPRLKLPSRTLETGLEMQADKGILVGAPSRHASGQRYEIVDDRPPAELPDAWIDLALRPAGTPPVNGVLGYRHRGCRGDGGRLRSFGLDALPTEAIARADEVVERLLRGPNAEEVAGLLAGDQLANTMPDKSLSGADFRLGRLVKRHTRDPLVVAAVLWQSALARDKYERPDYLPRTVDAVLRDDPAWVAQQRDRPAHPVGRRGVRVRPRVMAAIVRRVVDAPDDERDGDGLTRLAVGELAAAEGVSEETVRLAVNDLDKLGVIVTRVATRRSSSSGWERERRIALTVSPGTALAAIETGTPVVRPKAAELPSPATAGRG